MSKKNKPESGERGSPENQPRAEAAEAAAGAKELTSSGVASLLKSEFAADEPEEAAGGAEVQPESEAGETQAGTAEGESAEGGAAADTTEAGEAEGGEEPAEAAAAAAGEKLPEELQSAIDQWEAAGKGELPAVLQKLVDRRIGKLTAERAEQASKREAAEARATELAAALEELKANPAQTVATAGPADEKTLVKLERTSRSFLNDAENFLDGTATAEEQGRIERYMETNRLDEKGLKRAVREVNTYLTTELPEAKRAAGEFKRQEAAAEPEARKWFPFLYDAKSPDYEKAKQVLAAMPDLATRTPLHKLIAGVYVLGLKEWERLRAGAGKGLPAKAKAPVKAPTAGAAAPAGRVNGHQAEESAAREEFSRRPTRESVSKLLSIGLRE